MGMRTINLKLHNPGRRKREIIDEAMLNYSKAYQYLLDKAHKEIDSIENKYCDQRGEYRAANIEKWINKEMVKELNSFNIEPFKDSLKIDFSMTIASYLTLKKLQTEVSYPLAYVSDEDWYKINDKGLNELSTGEKNNKSYLKEMRRLADKNDLLKPIFFCRYAKNRDYCLLYDNIKDRYYVKLYLMNVKSTSRCSLNINNDNELVYIHKDKGILEKSCRKERYILVPLAFGKWQEQYMKNALVNPEMLKTARLVNKNGEYYISVNIDIGKKERSKEKTYLGITRGLKNALNYTIVDLTGSIIKNGVINTKAKAVGEIGDIPVNSIHAIANDIVNLAKEYDSQVVMQAFINKGDRLQWVSKEGKFIPALNYHCYNKLLSILDYKLDGEGLKTPVKVSPVGIFYTCPNCGLHSVKNRFSKDIFICTECGTAINIEALGSLNAARKLINYRSGLLKVKVEKTQFGVRFINKELGLDFSPENEMDSLEEFECEIKRIINDFYENMNNLPRNKAFKKKYSLIKKIEEEKDLTKLIKVI